jgi:hypothetical protein
VRGRTYPETARRSVRPNPDIEEEVEQLSSGPLQATVESRDNGMGVTTVSEGEAESEAGSEGGEKQLHRKATTKVSEVDCSSPSEVEHAKDGLFRLVVEVELQRASEKAQEGSERHLF